jgi:hypothetical protein
MSRGRDWDKQRLRARQQRYGSEPVTGSSEQPPPRKRPPSKAALRVDAARALADWKARQLKEAKP